MNNISKLEKDFIIFFNRKGFKIKNEINVVRKFDSRDTMFVIAGMVQFKKLFYSNELKDKYVNSQTCLRLVDIDQIGEDNFRLSLFKMLGLFSFNFAYSIQNIMSDIIEFLLSQNFKHKNIRVSVHKDNKDIIEFWKKLNIHDIVINTDENIWKETNSNHSLEGKCTEIFYKYNNEWVEIGNIVLLQNPQNKQDQVYPHLDVGLGLERIFLIKNNKSSILQLPYFHQLQKYFKRKFPNINNKILSILLVNFHNLLFLFNNNVKIEHDKHGYILKKIIRTICMHLYLYNSSFKKINIILIFKFLIEDAKNYFPILITLEKLNLIRNMILEQERIFYKCFNVCSKILEKNKKKNIDAKIIFELYTTYGMPKFFLKIFVSKIHNKQTDWDLVEQFIFQHKIMSRNIKETIKKENKHEWLLNLPKTIFVDYNLYECDAVLIKKYQYKDFLCLLFDKTVFFPEKGGQTEDKGWINNIIILNVIEIDQYIIHILDLKYLESFKEKQSYKLKIDIEHRKCLSANHSAVHIINGIINKYIFPDYNIIQNGSFISAEQFRFDLQILNDVDINKNIIHILKQSLNKVVYNKLFELQKQNTIIREDINNKVRTVYIGEFLEKCCGTHINNIKQLQYIFIDKIHRVTKNNIRIHGYTNQKAQEYNNCLNLLQQDIFFMLNASETNVKEQINLIKSWKTKNKILKKQIKKILQQFIKEAVKNNQTKIRLDLPLLLEDIIFLYKTQLQKIILDSNFQINDFVIQLKTINKTNKNILFSDSNVIIYREENDLTTTHTTQT